MQPRRPPCNPTSRDFAPLYPVLLPRASPNAGAPDPDINGLSLCQCGRSHEASSATTHLAKEASWPGTVRARDGLVPPRVPPVSTTASLSRHPIQALLRKPTRFAPRALFAARLRPIPVLRWIPPCNTQGHPHLHNLKAAKLHRGQMVG